MAKQRCEICNKNRSMRAMLSMEVGYMFFCLECVSEIVDFIANLRKEKRKKE